MLNSDSNQLSQSSGDLHVPPITTTTKTLKKKHLTPLVDKRKQIFRSFCFETQCPWVFLFLIKVLGRGFWTDLSDAFALHLQSLHLREVVIIGHHVGDHRLFIGLVHADVCTTNNTKVSSTCLTQETTEETIKIKPRRTNG